MCTTVARLSDASGTPLALTAREKLLTHAIQNRIEAPQKKEQKGK